MNLYVPKYAADVFPAVTTVRRSLMRKPLLSCTLLTLLALLAVVLAACQDPVKPEPPVDPDDPNQNAFWLKEESVFSPTDIQRTATDKNVAALYQDIKVSKPDDILLTCGEQVLALGKNAAGETQLYTYIVNGDDYIPMFDGGAPILPGIGGIKKHTAKTVEGDEAVVLEGENNTASYTLTCVAMKEEGLFHFLLEVKLRSLYRFNKKDIGLTMTGEAEVSYAQAPGGIYENIWGYDNVGMGMPAAYLWDKGREAVIFVDYTDMTWMEKDVYRVPENGYVDAKVRNGNTVFGLCYGFDKNGRPITGGSVASGKTMVVDIYLYAGLSAKRSGLDCLTQKALVMAPIHPTAAPYLPTIRKEYQKNTSLTWECFADGTVSSLFHEEVLNMVSMNMRDPILSDTRTTEHYVSYDRQSQQENDRRTHQDFSCNYNWLSSLAAYNRIKGNADVAKMVSSKMDSMQFYYDPESNLYRWGLRYKNQVDNVNGHLESVEMPWQNLFYHQETYRSAMAAEDKDFSPAAVSNLLSALGGLDELVKNSNYVLSQWINPYKKVSTTQRDVPALKIVYEPWQIGTYADLLLKAYDMTGSTAYLDEAKTAIVKVAEEVTYKVKNDVYEREYTDSADFPLTELFGSANGMSACYRIFQLTGEEKWLSYSEAFFAMLMQMTTWYEDETDGASRTMTNIGMFEPTAAGAHVCPWETIEALLPMTHILDATGDYAFNDLMLATFNCQRISAFNFFPVTWSNHFRGTWAYNETDFLFVPIETPYNTWHGGNSDYVAIYMASMSFWNYLLYEAYAEVDNAALMTLFTDVQGESYEAAARGASRSFIVYNPTDKAETVTFRQKELPDGNYTVTVNGGEATEYTKDQLVAGISLTVEARGDLRIQVTSTDVDRLVAANQDIMARYRLIVAYNALTEKVQGIARTKFATLYSDASDKDLDALANYVLTYMSYEDAMAHALNRKSVTGLKQELSERNVVTVKLKKAYNEREDVQLPAEYTVLTESLDEAYLLFRDGNYKDAYLLCDAIVKALENGTEKDLAASLAADSETNS